MIHTISIRWQTVIKLRICKYPPVKTYTKNNIVDINENIDNLTTPTFTDDASIYTTLNVANTAAETASNAIKSKISIFKYVKFASSQIR